MKKIIQKIIKTKSNRGFTLLETLVAVFILVLAITGPMVFAQSSLRTAFLSRDQITAFFLAQDAIESIKNIRDDNALKSKNWLDGIYVCSGNVGDACLVSLETLYDYDPVSGKEAGEILLEECSSGTCPVLKNDSVGRFGYTFVSEETTNSRFTRNIYLNEVVRDNDSQIVELQIVVEVIWTSNVKVQESRIVVQENIFNWIPIPENS